MKKLILVVLLSVSAAITTFSATNAPIVTRPYVLTDTNGVVVYPTNLWAANSNQINSVVAATVGTILTGSVSQVAWLLPSDGVNLSGVSLASYLGGNSVGFACAPGSAKSASWNIRPELVLGSNFVLTLSMLCTNTTFISANPVVEFVLSTNPTFVTYAPASVTVSNGLTGTNVVTMSWTNSLPTNNLTGASVRWRDDTNINARTYFFVNGRIRFY